MPAGVIRERRGRYGITWTGIDQVMRQLRPGGPVWRRCQAALRDAMIDNTEDLLGRGMRDAPVAEGTLRATGHAAVFVDGRRVSRLGTHAVRADTGRRIATSRLHEAAAAGTAVTHRVGERAVMEGGMGDAIVGEAGFDTPYALIQHEHEGYRHPKGGKCRYLSDNLNARAERYLSHLRAAIGRALR